MTILKIIKYIPVFFSLLIMGLIFWFSSQTGTASGELSIKITRCLAGIIYINFNSMDAELQNQIISGLHLFVRKAAHFSVYALLGFNVLLSARIFLKTPVRQILTALAVCAAYACFDEFYQLFVPERTGSALDVLIDTGGALTGIIAAVVIIKLIKICKGTK